MKKLKLLITFFTIILIVSSSVASAQGKLGLVGKLFSQQDAKVLFGKVIGSMEINASELKKACANAKDYVLISIKNNRVIIRDERKRSLSLENESLNDKDVLYIFSKNQVEQLLGYAKPRISTSLGVAASGDPVVTVERRASVLTLKAGENVLEMALPCPPICAN
jgi:hypothetical protein